MKNKFTLTALLSAGLTVLSITFSLAQSSPPPAGFEGAKTMTDTDAFNYVNQYKASGGTITGGVITRDALEQLLKLSNCNAITYRLGTDPTGRVAPANEVFIIIGGANVTDDNGRKTVSDIGGSKYYSNLWCPPNCMKFMILDPNTGQLVPQE